jgi:hypothetical protein
MVHQAVVPSRKLLQGVRLVRADNAIEKMRPLRTRANRHGQENEGLRKAAWKSRKTCATRRRQDGRCRRNSERGPRQGRSISNAD